MNQNMCCTKFRLLSQKIVLMVSLLQFFLLAQTAVKLRNSQIHEKLSTLVRPELFQFLLSFCTYLWYFFGKIFQKYMDPVTSMGWEKKCPCQMFFSFSKIKALL